MPRVSALLDRRHLLTAPSARQPERKPEKVLIRVTRKLVIHHGRQIYGCNYDNKRDVAPVFRCPTRADGMLLPNKVTGMYELGIRQRRTYGHHQAVQKTSASK